MKKTQNNIVFTLFLMPLLIFTNPLMASNPCQVKVNLDLDLDVLLDKEVTETGKSLSFFHDNISKWKGEEFHFSVLVLRDNSSEKIFQKIVKTIQYNPSHPKQKLEAEFEMHQSSHCQNVALKIEVEKASTLLGRSHSFYKRPLKGNTTKVAPGFKLDIQKSKLSDKKNHQKQINHDFNSDHQHRLPASEF